MNADFSSTATPRHTRYPAVENRLILQPSELVTRENRSIECPIAGIEPCSLIDYPGQIAAVLFMAGCNLNCRYCHNPLLINPQPKRSFMTLPELLSFLHERRSLLDGVVISGGEPSLQANLAPFISQIRGLGYKIKLDSNGTRPLVLESLLSKGLLDFIAMDVKAPPQDAALYVKICGGEVDTASIRQSIDLIRNHARFNPEFSYEFRTTACAGLDVQDIMGIGAAL
jgi:pyruvate formate lyase activating enzyme